MMYKCLMCCELVEELDLVLVKVLEEVVERFKKICDEFFDAVLMVRMVVVMKMS